MFRNILIYDDARRSHFFLRISLLPHFLNIIMNVSELFDEWMSGGQERETSSHAADYGVSWKNHFICFSAWEFSSPSSGNLVFKPHTRTHKKLKTPCWTCLLIFIICVQTHDRRNLITASIFHFLICLLTDAPAPRKTSQTAKKATTSSSTNDSGEDSDHDDTESSEEHARIASRSISLRRPSVMAAALKAHHYGSFYLRMGAVGESERLIAII